jgi:hypothetical protein
LAQVPEQQLWSSWQASPASRHPPLVAAHVPARQSFEQQSLAFWHDAPTDAQPPLVWQVPPLHVRLQHSIALAQVSPVSRQPPPSLTQTGSAKPISSHEPLQHGTPASLQKLPSGAHAAEPPPPAVPALAPLPPAPPAPPWPAAIAPAVAPPPSLAAWPPLPALSNATSLESLQAPASARIVKQPSQAFRCRLLMVSP